MNSRKDYTTVKPNQQPPKLLALPRYKRWQLAKAKTDQIPRTISVEEYNSRQRKIWAEFNL